MTKWAERMREAWELERQFHLTQTEAVSMRCSVEDSGGARCTADAEPEHAHRYRREDLP